MKKAPWINSKECNFDHISILLTESIQNNQLTNYGPVVRKLEEYIKKEFNVSSNKSVIITVNAAIGLDVLISGIIKYEGKKLKFATQAFTFPCAAQGILRDSQIVDLDENLSFNLLPVDNDIDGIIVTNLFGNVCDINKYVNWCNLNNKLLIFDNATVPCLSKYGDFYFAIKDHVNFTPEEENILRYYCLRWKKINRNIIESFWR